MEVERAGRSIFPFLFGGTFIEAILYSLGLAFLSLFPFLFGGTFIEASVYSRTSITGINFPSFSEGLSLRQHRRCIATLTCCGEFPFLFGGTFIEAVNVVDAGADPAGFPFLFGGTFIEAPTYLLKPFSSTRISLPFRRDFH